MFPAWSLVGTITHVSGERTGRLSGGVFLAVVGLAVVLVIGPHKAATPEGTVADTDNAVGAFVEWEALHGPDRLVCKADPDLRWVAVRTPLTGRLRVWSLRADLSLGDLLLDSKDRGFVVREFAWCGDRLLYWMIAGIDDDAQFERAPPERPWEFVSQHSSIVAWNPDGKTVHVLAKERAYRILPTPDGTRAAAFGWGGTDEDAVPVSVYGVPSGAVVHSFLLRITRRYTATVDPPGVIPIGWSADGKGFYATGEALPELAGPAHAALEAQAARMAVGRGARWAVLLWIGMDGTIEQLSNRTSACLWTPLGLSSTFAPWTPRQNDLNATPVRTGRLIACSLAPWGSQVPRLGFFDEKGLSYDYPLWRHARGEGPEGIQDGGYVNTVTITPDGACLLLAAADREGMTTPHSTRWVWAWDYRRKEGRRVAPVPEITGIFGWGREEYLLVETAGPVESSPGGTLRYTHNYGLLHVPPQITS